MILTEEVGKIKGKKMNGRSIALISSRELQVLEMISFGHSAKEIAEELYISTHTVDSHWKNLKIKLDARNAAQLIRKGFQMGYLTY